MLAFRASGAVCFVFVVVTRADGQLQTLSPIDGATLGSNYVLPAATNNKYRSGNATISASCKNNEIQRENLFVKQNGYETIVEKLLLSCQSAVVFSLIF